MPGVFEVQSVAPISRTIDACLETGDPATYSGIGNGGQHIVVVPEHDLVIAITAGLDNDPRQGQIEELLERLIGGAAKRR
jgi:CubicO group peptidase (beta-lactamase class C family)